jgi:hypothetical protein
VQVVLSLQETNVNLIAQRNALESRLLELESKADQNAFQNQGPLPAVNNNISTLGMDHKNYFYQMSTMQIDSLYDEHQDLADFKHHCPTQFRCQKDNLRHPTKDFPCQSVESV